MNSGYYKKLEELCAQMSLGSNEEMVEAAEKLLELIPAPISFMHEDTIYE